MRKVVLTYGLIAGGMLGAMMALTLPFHEQLGNGMGMVVGFATMFLAFLMVYFGVRSYRDNVAGGRISFGRALKVGGLIALIASCCYVATWEVIYFNFMPDFAEKYAATAIEKARKDGASEERIAEITREMNEFAVNYRNPLINVAYTFVEPLPVALLYTLVTAGLLSRSRRDDRQPSPA